MELYEQVRPQTWEAVLGQPKAVALIRGVLKRQGGPGGKAFFVTGPSGVGKKSIARLIAKELPGPSAVHEFGTADDLDAKELADIEGLYGMTRRGLDTRTHCILVHEAHGLNARQCRVLLKLLEPVPERVCWVFTTTWAGENWLEDAQIDASALFSRCVSGGPIRLTNQALAKTFAPWLREVAQAHNLDGQPIPAYEKLMAECKNNPRMALQKIAAGYMLEENK